MKIAPFRIEKYFAFHEFTAPHLLSSSDAECVSIADILALVPTPQTDSSRNNFDIRRVTVQRARSLAGRAGATRPFSSVRCDGSGKGHSTVRSELHVSAATNQTQTRSASKSHRQRQPIHHHRSRRRAIHRNPESHSNKNACPRHIAPIALQSLCPPYRGHG